MFVMVLSLSLSVSFRYNEVSDAMKRVTMHYAFEQECTCRLPNITLLDVARDCGSLLVRLWDASHCSSCVAPTFTRLLKSGPSECETMDNSLASTIRESRRRHVRPLLF